jgi:hypothetical protein
LACCVPESELSSKLSSFCDFNSIWILAITTFEEFAERLNSIFEGNNVVLQNVKKVVEMKAEQFVESRKTTYLILSFMKRFVTYHLISFKLFLLV